MVTLEDVVDKLLSQMTANQELFTALDVSNAVKAELPLARHREVRDLVRAKFSSHIEPAGYARTPIQVTLNDGSSVEALLYHPLVDSWDLDSKYDAQKRAQTSSAAIPAVNVVANPNNTPVVSSSPVSTLSAPTISAPVIPVPSDARSRWQQLFNSQPSLFPRR